MSAPASRTRFRPLALLLTLLLAITGLSLPALAASAAPGDVTGGSASWGVDAGYRAIFTTRASAGGASFTADDLASWPASTSSTYDAATRTGTIALTGNVRIGYFAGAPLPGVTDGNYVYLSNPVITLTGDTGTISASSAGSSHRLNPDLPNAALASRTIATLDLTGVTPAVSSGALTWSSVPVAIAAGGTEVLAFYGSASDTMPQKRAVGSALDPISFSLTLESATATSTTLAVSPPTGAVAGADVTLTATVAPAASGTVQFVDGATPLGSPVAVAAGSASLVTVALGSGEHSLSAVFTSADSAFAGSTSAPTAYAVVAADPDDIATTTTLATAPAAGPVRSGTSVTLRATVSADDATLPGGSVEFFSIPASGTGAVSLGTAPVSGGVAELSTTALVAGGHRFRAAYTPADGYLASAWESAATANFGVVDPSAPAVCAPGAGATTSSGATARWDVSAYSTDWVKTATGDITVDGPTFVLANGRVTADAACAEIAFTGSLRVAAYTTLTTGGYAPHGAWVELVNPTLTVSSGGTGVWTAEVRSAEKVAPGTQPTTRVAVGIVDTATGLPAAGASGTATVAFRYADSTAPGTWSVAGGVVRDDAWPNGFVLQVVPSIQSFFFETAAAGNPRKPASPLSVTFAWPAAAVAPPVAAGSLTWGVKASFRSYITGPIAQGSIGVSGGATSTGRGYWFPQASSSLDASTGLGSVRYRGTVAFTGHGGALAVTLADPAVRVTGGGSAMLSVATSDGRVDVASLALGSGSRSVDGSGAVTYAGVPATLTTAGVPVFGGFYPAGTALDAVTFTIGSTNSASGAASTVSATRAAAANTPDATPPATEGVESASTAFTAGEEATFTAGGYRPGETGILAVVYSTPTVLADDLVADAAGRVTWTGRLPAGLTGEHTFTFQGSVDTGLVINIAAPAVVGCPVESARLDWGFKESFRAYIDGSIANGAWTTADGASYATPVFTWSDGRGGYDGERGDADLAFTGSVRFTGHGGLLDTTIANPRVVIDGTRAVVLLDVTGTTQEGEVVAQTAVEFADLDLASATRAAEGDVVTLTGIPATLTDAGAAAFGTYPAGEELDPVDLTVTIGADCVPVAAAAEGAAAPAIEETGASSPVWPWVLLAVVIGIVAAVLVVVVVRRIRAAA